MIKVLHILSGIGYQGGVQSLLWNYYKKLDTELISFDFVVHSNVMKGYEKKFLDRGANIYYVPPKRNGIIQNYQGLCEIMKKNKYDIVHVHQDFLGYIALKAAKKNGIKVRIMHTHKANMEENIIKKIYRIILTKYCELYATDFFACGKEAAIWTYGKKLFFEKKVYILNNAIEPTDFLYDENRRMQVRDELGIQNKFVIGNVARFTYQKNHNLLIDIFLNILKEKKDAILLLVGDGELKNEIEEEVKKNKIEENVLFLGNRDDVNYLLQAMDVFVLTSRFEGLPVTMVEAQAADLKCVVTNNTTHELKITDNIVYIDANDSIKKWSYEICKLPKKNRSNMLENIRKNGFDINLEVKKLEQYYLNAVNNREGKNYD